MKKFLAVMLTVVLLAGIFVFPVNAMSILYPPYQQETLIGKLGESLVEKLETLEDDEKIEVYVATYIDPFDPDATLKQAQEITGLNEDNIETVEQSNVLRGEYIRLMIEYFTSHNEQVIEKLNLDEDEVVSIDPANPCFNLKITKEKIYEIAEYDEIMAIYLPYNPDDISLILPTEPEDSTEPGDGKLSDILKKVAAMSGDDSEIPVIIFAKDAEKTAKDLAEVCEYRLKKIEIEADMIYLSLAVGDLEKAAGLDGIYIVTYDYDGSIGYEELGLNVGHGAYLTKFFEKCGNVTVDALAEYDEVYYHTDENDETDWAIVMVDYDSGIAEEVIVSGVVGGRTIFSPTPKYPFYIGYAVFDVKKDAFFDVAMTPYIFEKYDGLYEAFNALDLGDLSPAVIPGDANSDGTTSVADATRVQRFCAKLISKAEIEQTAADVTGDGVVTVLDATRIQRYCAKLCALDGGEYTEE